MKTILERPVSMRGILCAIGAAVLPIPSVVAQDAPPARVGPTVEITRSHDYCWFPTVHRFRSGELMVGVVMCPDQKHPEGNFSAYCLSKDKGATWSRRYPMGQEANQDGAWSEVSDRDDTIWQWASYPEPVRDGDGTRFYTALTKYGRGGRTVTIDRDVTLRMAHRVYLAPTNLYAYSAGASGAPLADTQYKTQYNLRAWGNIITGANGDLLSTVYYLTAEDNVRYQPHPREHFRIVLVRSTDGGRSWAEDATIATLPDSGRPAWFGEGPTEGSLALLADGRIYAIYRTGGHDGTIGQSWSSDGGKTWTAPASIGFEGVAPRVHRLANGALALVTGRPGPVMLRFNLDGRGEHWSRPITIFTGMSSRYTDLTEVEPGKLLVVYDSLPYGWHEIPYSDRDGRNVVFGTFVEMRKN